MEQCEQTVEKGFLACGSRGGKHRFELHLEKYESGKGIPDRRSSVCKVMRARNTLEYSDKRGSSMRVKSGGIKSRQ